MEVLLSDQYTENPYY